MISGGLGKNRDALHSVEIYQPRNKSGGCRIADMPAWRYSTVTAEFLVCGSDRGHASRKSRESRECIKYKKGVWTEAHKLNQDRIR